MQRIIPACGCFGAMNSAETFFLDKFPHVCIIDYVVRERQTVVFFGNNCVEQRGSRRFFCYNENFSRVKRQCGNKLKATPADAFCRKRNDRRRQPGVDGAAQLYVYLNCIHVLKDID